jgi:hypothetical protein
MTEREQQTNDGLRESVAKPHDPAWSEVEYPRGGARDALRLETAGEAMLEDLLPGINNGTQRARYYSFWAWVLHEFIRDKDAIHTQNGFYEWLRPREAMLVLSHLLHGHDTGAAGTTQGTQVWQNGVSETYPLDWRSLTSVKGGAYQLYYIGALEEMNIVARESEKPHDVLQQPVGVRLAEAYGRSVRNTGYVRSHWNATRATRSLVEDFADAGCLCRLPCFPEERKALVDAFFRFDVNDWNAVKRLASLSFFLDVVDQSQGAPLDLTSMRATTYFWSYGADHPYVPERNLLSPAKRWRTFQLRQYFVYALECLWALFLKRIHGRRFTPDEYLDTMLSTLDLGAVGKRYGVPLTATDPYRLPLADFQLAVETAATDARFEPGPAALEVDLNEHHLYLAIERARSASDVDLWAGGALLMLSLLRRRCRDWRGDAGWSYATGAFGADRLPVEAYLGHSTQAIYEGWTVAEWLSWIHQRYLWLRHRQVALQKMAFRGVDPSLFTWDENRFYGVGTDQPKMNGPRYQNALRIMEDLGLVRGDWQDGRQTYALLPEGQELLQRFRSYTIPEVGEGVDHEGTSDADPATGQ